MVMKHNKSFMFIAFSSSLLLFHINEVNRIMDSYFNEYTDYNLRGDLAYIPSLSVLCTAAGIMTFG